jgi:hypothetical protein
MAIGPIVPTADAARELYETISSIRHAPIRAQEDILVNDKGDYWEVYQYHDDSAVQVINGVETVRLPSHIHGALNLEIKKCDGATVGYYNR